MQKRLLVPFVTVVLVVAAFGAVSWLRPVSAQTPRGGTRDVIIVRCDLSPNAVKLTAYDASTGAPAKRAAGCAESLSLLHRDGFQMIDTAHFDRDSGYLVYTLVR